MDSGYVATKNIIPKKYNSAPDLKSHIAASAVPRKQSTVEILEVVAKCKHRQGNADTNKNMPGGETTGICIFMWRLRTNIN